MDEYGISVYALEKNKMVDGDPKARAVQFFLDSAVVPLELIGDGLLPPDVDGKTKPKNDAPAPIVARRTTTSRTGPRSTRSTSGSSTCSGTRDRTRRSRSPRSCRLRSSTRTTPAADSRLPPAAGDHRPDQYLDILSYRRPTQRLAYRSAKDYETMVTSQSVEARPAVAGMRWYEIRRNNASGDYSLYQQGTYAPNDGVHRWMGSIAQDKNGNTALGYSVVNATTVFPGIRYTGRLAGDPLGQMTQGEGVIINGSGVQTTLNSRWGDYTSLNVDPVDDCTFWYVNEYYQVSGLPLPPPPPLPPPGTTAPWQTRIASFKLPGC